MGTGKSQSAITYMNEHHDQRFIYITPFLDEAKRIKDGCPSLNFVEPDNRLFQYGNSKVHHTAALIAQGKNITSTHQAFRNYTPEMINDIQRLGYTLIIDENMSVLEKADFHPYDIAMLVETGHLSFDGRRYRTTERRYRGREYAELFHLIQDKDLMQVGKMGTPQEEADSGEMLFYWSLDPKLLTSFKDVIVLTYLFKGQSLYNMFQMYSIPMEYIGVERTTTGNGFRFCSGSSYVPEYVYHIWDMIHIADDEKLNSVGESGTALSMTWYDKDPKNVDVIKSRLHSWFRYINKDIPSKEKMWSTYERDRTKLAENGYSKGFVSFNARSSNQYRDRTCLAYAVNLYMNVGDKSFYQSRGVDVSDDDYALSIMLQWIWRSAIRDGKEISIYIPSSRMRNLLIDWMNKITKEANEISHEKEDV